MRMRVLGRTGLSVSEVGYGGGQLRGTPRIWNGRPVSDEQAARILHAVLDAGINFIDTASVYGHSEAFIGRHISSRRSDFLIATKFGCQLKDMGDWDDTPRNWSPDFLKASLDESLRRLRTDRVDLLQLHTPTFDDFTRYDLLRPLEDARSAGKTRFIGLSVTQPHMDSFAPFFSAFDTVQLPYSAYELHYEAWVTRAAEQGCGTIIRGGVAQGSADQDGAGRMLWERARLDDLLEGETRTGFMLRFTLSQPHVGTVIAATINPDHLRENLAAARGTLSDDVVSEVKRRLNGANAAFGAQQ